MKETTRGNRHSKIGMVISNKMEKTITVSIERRVKHKKYGKYLTRYTKVKAHDEKNEARMGDRVEIMETRPLSKSKQWRLTKIIETKGSES